MWDRSGRLAPPAQLPVRPALRRASLAANASTRFWRREPTQQQQQQQPQSRSSSSSRSRSGGAAAEKPQQSQTRKQQPQSQSQAVASRAASSCKGAASVDKPLVQRLTIAVLLGQFPSRRNVPLTRPRRFSIWAIRVSGHLASWPSHRSHPSPVGPSLTQLNARAWSLSGKQYNWIAG
ncbi:uncharacterized protein LOC120321028 [Drosophila yakuba]|uniref:uncharacterized protein LOC120321028 n=1 Tax=Drosophila yakuba TaxID=7245 RepID=UPI001C8ACDEF|nr:uncharacterized protein LOC120321028 [Drosophila yakuba]